MNRSLRPPYKHNLLGLPLFDLTDRSETFQQTTVLRLSHCCRPLHIVASRILRSFEFDGQKFFIHCVQSNSIQSSPPESLLILIFWYWQPGGLCDLDGDDVAWHRGRRHVGRAGNVEELVAGAQAQCMLLARTMNSS
jgi:hypothetical protein